MTSSAMIKIQLSVLMDNLLLPRHAARRVPAGSAIVRPWLFDLAGFSAPPV
jgi:hypothetical protein